jgi:hypothetical protein
MSDSLDTFLPPPPLEPYSVASLSLCEAKAANKALKCISHGKCFAPQKSMTYESVIVESGRSRPLDVDGTHMCLVNANVTLECSRRELDNSYSRVSLEINGVRIVSMPMHFIALLNRSAPPQSLNADPLIWSRFITASKTYAHIFKLFRKAGIAKLVADLIISFVALADSDYTVQFPSIKPRYPHAYRELCQNLTDLTIQRFHLNLALPVGAGLPELRVYAQVHILLQNETSAAAELSIQTKWITRNGPDFDQRILLFQNWSSECPERVSREMYRLDLHTVLPTIAYILDRRSLPDNVDTIDLCLDAAPKITTCKTTSIIGMGTIPDSGWVHSIRFRVADCLVENNWLVLSIDRSLSLVEALHRSNFETVPDFIDTTRIAHVYLLFSNSAGLPIDDITKEIFYISRAFNYFRHLHGCACLLFH